jgi:hypothetical protein
MPSMENQFLTIRRFGICAAFTTVLFQASLASQSVIEPVTTLEIVNSPIQPDGVRREYVPPSLRPQGQLNVLRSSVLANGMFPGPLISAKKVHLYVSGHNQLMNLFTGRPFSS